MVLLSTSPGPGGASSVLAMAENSMKYFDGIVKSSFSLPNFYDNFDIKNNKIIDSGLASKLEEAVESLNVQ